MSTRTLILGGTRFLGRYLATACQQRGHRVTLFHRGLSDADALPEVEHLIGDRNGNLDAVRGKAWDIVFDTSGYDVAPVRAAALAVAHADVHYVFVSSISVYSDFTRVSDESAPRRHLDDAEHVALSIDSYGGLKAACEDAASEALPGRVQSIRAGLILGPHDYDARFAYWLRRIARGGEVLAPGKPEAFVQFIDVRDLAAWMVRSAEERRAGPFNVTGPLHFVTMSGLLDTIRTVTRSDARFTWVPDAFLVEHEVAPYSEMPFWLPEATPFRIDVTRAVDAGLAYRPVAETVRDTWAWLQTGWDAAASARAQLRIQVPAGIDDAREARLLAAFHGRPHSTDETEGVGRPKMDA